MNFPKTEQNRECVPYCTRTKRVGLKLKQIYTGCELTRRPRLPRCYMNYLYYTYNRHTIVRRVSSIRKIQIVCCSSTTELRIMCGVAGTDTETAFRAADAIRFAPVRRGAVRRVGGRRAFIGKWERCCGRRTGSTFVNFSPAAVADIVTHILTENKRTRLLCAVENAHTH